MPTCYDADRLNGLTHHLNRGPLTPGLRLITSLNSTKQHTNCGTNVWQLIPFDGPHAANYPEVECIHACITKGGWARKEADPDARTAGLRRVDWLSVTVGFV